GGDQARQGQVVAPRQAPARAGGRLPPLARRRRLGERRQGHRRRAPARSRATLVVVTFVEIQDGPTTWRFDRAFLESNWTCIWGRGCLGILDAPAEELGQGCCSVGAELGDVDEAMMISAL